MGIYAMVSIDVCYLAGLIDGMGWIGGDYVYLKLDWFMERAHRETEGGGIS